MTRLQKERQNIGLLIGLIYRDGACMLSRKTETLNNNTTKCTNAFGLFQNRNCYVTRVSEWVHECMRVHVLSFFVVVGLFAFAHIFSSFRRCKVFASMASNLNIYFAPLGKAQKVLHIVYIYSPINVTILNRSYRQQTKKKVQCNITQRKTNTCLIYVGRIRDTFFFLFLL